ncbi:MAG TPA: MFS transporter [Acidimicrobiales bacterium]|nr:MFS transporter [Acidimicrobiales bacterium]
MPRSTPRQTLRRLTVIVAIQWMGASLGLPLLPLFLEHRGGTPTIIGFIVASFFVAGVATQFALGHMADRFGRRPILLGGLVVFGVASMTFLFPVSAPWFALTRAVQGAAAGAIEVASLSVVASLFPQAERGRAVSRIFAAQLLGLAIGPMAGVIVSVKDLGYAFAATGVLSLLAAVVTSRTYLGGAVDTTTALPRLNWSPQLVGALVAGASIGLAIGVYEACWSLLMHNHHASTLQIRLSWTMFCIPFAAFSGIGGWLADHVNRRVIVLIGLLNAALFLALYPHIHSNVTLLFLGSVESMGAALTAPATASLLTQGAADRELSRRQGLYATANTASLAAAAAVSGVLFTRDPALPFSVIAVLTAATALTTLWWWRNVEGRVALAT